MAADDETAAAGDLFVRHTVCGTVLEMRVNTSRVGDGQLSPQPAQAYCPECGAFVTLAEFDKRGPYGAIWVDDVRH